MDIITASGIPSWATRTARTPADFRGSLSQAQSALSSVYGSVAQRELNASNEFKDHVVSLSQTFLESGQIATEFERKPSEKSIKKHADNNERQLAASSRVEGFVTDLRDDDPMKEATSLRSVINLYATRFQNVVSAQRNLGFNEN